MHRFRRIRNIVVIWTLITIPHVFAHPAEGFGQSSPLRTVGSSSSKGFDLEKAAEKHFPNLSEAERTLLKAVPIGDAVVCSSSCFKPDSSEPDREVYALKRQRAPLPCWLSSQATSLLTTHDYHPKEYLDNAKTWESDRTIRAGLIRWLAVDPDASKQIDPKGLWITGARISGAIDFAFVSLPHPLALLWCSIPEGINLQNATLQRLDLEHSQTTLVQAQNLVVGGDCLIRHGFKADRVNLLDAKISGSLDFNGSYITDPGYTALELQGVEVGNVLWLAGQFWACGAVHLPDANIHGDLDISSGTFIASDDCGKRTGPFRGDDPSDGVAIDAYALTVSGDVDSDPEKTLVRGALELGNSSVGGDLQIQGDYSRLKNGKSQDDLISALDTVVKGEILVGMTSNGSVDLNGDETPHLIVKNAKLSEGANLSLTALNVKHKLQIDSFQLADGSKVSLRDSNTMVLEYNRRPLPRPGEIEFDGLTYQRLRFGDNVLFGDPLMRLQKQPAEWIRLIDGNSFQPQPYRQLAKVLADVDEEASRDVMIQMEDRQFELPGWVHWPRRAVQAPVDMVLWLLGSPGLGFAFCVVVILLLWWAVSRKAALVAFTGLVVLLGLVLASLNNFPSSALLMKMTIQYGYVPLLALIWSALIVVFGWEITRMAKKAKVMAPSKENDTGTVKNDQPVGKEPLSPFLYSLNLFLPIVDLHQEKNWWPDVEKNGSYQLFGQGKTVPIRGSVVRWYFWFQIIAGWVLSGFFIAGFSGLIKHG